MITGFGNRIARDIWEQGTSKALPASMHLRAKVLLTIMQHTNSLGDLVIQGQPPKLRLHKLGGDRKGTWSVTIDLPWCITFKFKDGRFSDVRIENYHKG